MGAVTGRTQAAARTREAGGPLTPGELDAMDAYWRAANYLAVGQIYLCANPLLRELLRLEHVKQRLLGHWGTSPVGAAGAHIRQAMRDRRIDHWRYITEHGEDPPEIREWTWEGNAR